MLYSVNKILYLRFISFPKASVSHADLNKLRITLAFIFPSKGLGSTIGSASYLKPHGNIFANIEHLKLYALLDDPLWVIDFIHYSYRNCFAKIFIMHCKSLPVSLKIYPKLLTQTVWKFLCNYHSLYCVRQILFDRIPNNY